MKMEKFTLRSQGLPFKEVGSSPAKEDETTSSNIMAGFDMSSQGVVGDTTSKQDTSISVQTEEGDKALAEAKKLKEEESDAEILARQKQEEDIVNPDVIETGLADQVYSKQKVDIDLASRGYHTEGDIRGTKVSQEHKTGGDVIAGKQFLGADLG